tara:strand:- start:63 stop:356 length:294 start_codon:yes stop_codon:yes gene_type:complete
MRAAPACVADTPKTFTRNRGKKSETDINDAPKKKVDAFALRNTGSAKSRISRIGPGAMRERRTKAASSKHPVIIKQIVSQDSQDPRVVFVSNPGSQG